MKNKTHEDCFLSRPKKLNKFLWVCTILIGLIIVLGATCGEQSLPVKITISILVALLIIFYFYSLYNNCKR
jgi:ABC-type Fe3+-siderophore transport system permease subunit